MDASEPKERIKQIKQNVQRCNENKTIDWKKTSRAKGLSVIQQLRNGILSSGELLSGVLTHLYYWYSFE